jgi:hypothetical protein
VIVELSISDHEAASVLPALSYFDEEVLPHSVPRIELYRLIKYIQEKFGFEGYEGYVPTVSQSFSGEVRTLTLSPDAADYMERALSSAISLGSCEEQCEEELNSEYAGCFNRDIQILYDVDLRLRDALGPHCFEPSPQNRDAWNEVFGVSG